MSKRNLKFSIYGGMFRPLEINISNRTSKKFLTGPEVFLCPGRLASACIAESEEIRMKVRKTFIAVVVGIVMLAAGANRLWAVSIDIPNASFELPETTFPDPNIDSWQESPTPWWYDESGGYLCSSTSLLRTPTISTTAMGTRQCGCSRSRRWSCVRI